MVAFKKFILDEMTMKAGDLSQGLRQDFDKVSKETDRLKHMGDIDSVKIMRFKEGLKIIDLMKNNDQNIGMMVGNVITIKINETSQEALEMKQWFILPEYQRHGLGEKYLYFLKNVLKTAILFGTVHSTATQEFLKKTAVQKRFKMSWYNVKSGEIEDFSKDKYSYLEPNDWQVLIEQDNHQVFNQFKTGAIGDGIRDTYE